MDTPASVYAAAEALIAELQRIQSDPEKLKQVCDDTEISITDKARFEYEAWKAAGCPDMEAKDGDDLREWRDVGFPLWFTIKSLKTFEPVKKQQQGENGASSASTGVIIKTEFGARKAIANTPLPSGKKTVLGGGPLVEYTFGDAYREDQKAYMAANGLKGLSASRWA
ncbi:hypothetical protein PG985_015560 [Apiospora marii]|uniref:Uncharacterized protein n=1 Tax=Apiospora marii TaxID=335849 RepID=A0ABR1S515_9PEZI